MNIRKPFFTVKVVKHWHRLPKDIAECLSWKILRSQMDMVLSNLRTSGWLQLTLL